MSKNNDIAAEQANIDIAEKSFEQIGKTGDFDVSAFVASSLGLSPVSNEADEERDFARETKIGELQLLDPTKIVIGERYRESLDLAELKWSLTEHGQAVPVMVLPDMTLVHGYRRVMACRELGREVLAHVVAVEDPHGMQIEEDRCRKGLTCWEMYRITESLRPEFESAAWSRKKFGKRWLKATKKGRTDDLLAEYVGISRGSLRKIREILNAHEQDPDRYGDVARALQSDGSRIDRHYRAFKEISRPKSEGPKFGAVLIKPEWQFSADAALATFQHKPLKDLADAGALMLVPAEIGLLPKALDLLAKAGAKLAASFRGTVPEESVWLLGTFGASDKLSDALRSQLADACDEGGAMVQEIMDSEFSNSLAVLSLGQAA